MGRRRRHENKKTTIKPEKSHQISISKDEDGKSPEDISEVESKSNGSRNGPKESDPVSVQDDESRTRPYKQSRSGSNKGQHISIQNGDGLNKRDFNIINLNSRIFSLFIAIFFSSFIYFNHQMMTAQSQIQKLVLEINTIYTPVMGPLTFGGGEESERDRINRLLDEWLIIHMSLQRCQTDGEFLSIKPELQRIIACIIFAYPFTPYFSQGKFYGGSPEPCIQVDLENNFHASLSRLKQQINFVNQINRRFTNHFKSDSELFRKVILLDMKAMQNADHESRKYVNGLIDYLDRYYSSFMKLAGAIKEYDYYMNKRNSANITWMLSMGILIFGFGILLPLSMSVFSRQWLWHLCVWYLPIFCFTLGLFVLSLAFFRV